MKTILKAMAIALIVIAANMTYSTLSSIAQKSALEKTLAEKQATVVEDKVLPVVGRAHVTFDGLGASIGFLVQDGNELKVIKYDEGSMADNEEWQPRYMKVVKFADGKTITNPVQVDKF